MQSIVYHLDNEGTSKKFYASNVILSTGASLDTIKELYQLLYQNKYLTNRVEFKMHNHSKVIHINYKENYSF